MVARELPMDRKLDIEFTWIQVAGGYIMPLSPRVGGVNIAICTAIDLLGFKHQNYTSEDKKFWGLKIGSVGWLAGVGWNAFSLFNLSLYVGGEWSFSSGGLVLQNSKTVRADIGRNTLFLGIQGTGRYFNLVGGIQKEWESLDYQKTVDSENSCLLWKFSLWRNIPRYYRKIKESLAKGTLRLLFQKYERLDQAHLSRFHSW
jgi:hypothetical protein